MTHVSPSAEATQQRSHYQGRRRAKKAIRNLNNIICGASAPTNHLAIISFDVFTAFSVFKII